MTCEAALGGESTILRSGVTAFALFITGGVPGGTGFVKLDGTVTSTTALTATTGCPCTLVFRIQQDGVILSGDSFTTLNDAVSGVYGTVTGSTTFAVSVPTGTFQTFRLKAAFTNSAGPLPSNFTWGALTAIYAPFGRFGTNTLSSSEEVNEESTPNSQ